MESPVTGGAAGANQDKKVSPMNQLLDSSGFWAVMGALIGGIFTFLAAVMSSSAEAERGRAAFFLEERVAVYSGLLSDAQAFQLSAARYNNIARLNGRDSAEAKAALDEAKADYDSAVAASWQVEVIATGAVQAAKESVAEELDRAAGYLENEGEEAAAYFRTVDQVMTGRTRQFAKAAAEELAADG